MNSLNWVGRQEWTDAGQVGEVPAAPRPWRNGAPPQGPVDPADRPWGHDDDFQRGGLLRVEPVPVGEDGLPVCCQRCQWAFELYSHLRQVVTSGWADGSFPLSEINGSWQFSNLTEGSCDGSFGSISGTPWGGVVSSLGGVINVQIEMTIFPTTIVINYTGPLTGIVNTLTLDGTPDPSWGTVPTSLQVVLAADCGPPPGEAITTDAGDPILTDAGDPITTD